MKIVVDSSKEISHSVFVMKVKFTSTVPSKPGRYLRKTSQNIDVITVIEIPEKEIYGVKFEKYLGISEMRGLAVAALRSEYNLFSDAIEEES